MRLHRFADALAAARMAAAITLEAAAGAVRARGAFFLALSGGTTPRLYFEELARLALEQSAGFPAWQVFFADERLVPASDARSNCRLARQAFLDRVPIPRANVHPVPFDAPSPRQAALAYAEEIARVLRPAGELPVFDFIHLGLGADGHTASLFPGDPGLAATGWVTHVAARPGEPGLERISLTLPVLNAARQVLFLAHGPGKLALARQIEEKGRESGFPAALVEAAATIDWVLAVPD